MARKCAVCSHPDKGAIEKAILSNDASNRRIATQFGMSEGAVRRHKATHMGAVSKAIASDPRVDTAKEGATQAVIQGFNSIQAVHEDWEWAKKELKDIAVKAKKTGKGNTRAIEAVARLATDKLNAYMKYAELRQENTPLEELPEFRALVGKLLVALEPYPRARLAVSEALRSE